ncbi:hypothetical protein [Hymenobacter sp. CRA2]|uniref:hypothetical protein n=1 Tax=Hymenobacter sp. CRA2 TaxID=1955620 RepID=UPI00098F554E|nr:hypothetical protein [Hymenobacter sp. CRA2]OON68788.1 hypothetical protein B0919_11415 [Hymenobacter sp. CRA2]
MLITIPDVTISEAEFATIATEQWLSQPKNRWVLWIYGLSGVVFLVLAGLRLWERAEDPTAPWPVFELIWVAFILLYVFWWRPYRLRQFFRKNYRSSAASQAACTYHFREDEIDNISDLARGSVRYEALVKARQRGRWLLLYFSDSGYAFIDVDKIQPPATAADLHQLLQQKGVNVS